MSICLEIELVWLSIVSTVYCTTIYPCTVNMNGLTEFSTPVQFYQWAQVLE
jgi:hypothetical protein